MLKRVFRYVFAMMVAAITLSPAAVYGQGAILHKSGAIQITNDGQFVWIANPDHDSVSRITVGSSFYLVSQFPLPNIGERHKPQGLAITPDALTVWVACHDSNKIVVVDQINGNMLTTIDLPYGSGPIAIAISPDGTKALVSLHRAGAMAVLDIATRTVTNIIDGMYRRPWGITFGADSTTAWVAHTLPDGLSSYVSLVSLQTNSVKAVIPLLLVNPRNVDQVQDDPVPVPEGGYILIRGHIAIPPGSGDLWVPCQYHNFLNQTMTAESTIQAAVHKINLTTLEHYVDNRVVLTALYAHLAADSTLVGDGWNAHIAGPIDVAFSADGATAYLVNNNSNDVVVVPTNITLAKPSGANPLTEIGVGNSPIGIVASPTSNKLFVANSLSRNVSIINATTNVEEARLAITFPTPEPLPGPVLRGAKLFNETVDPRVSGNQKTSCSSCHPDGESDSFPWEFAQFGAGTRKSLSLLGIGLTAGPRVDGRGQFHRAGDRDELQDFDHTFRMPFMGGTGLAPNINPPLDPAPNAGLNADLDAFAAFMNQLQPVRKSPYRGPSGELTEAAVRGAELFKSQSAPYATGCNSCHTSPTFVDLQFHDVGGFAPAPELQGPLFNTPTLVGAWDMPPYSNINGTVDAQTLGGVLRSSRMGIHGNTSGLNLTQMRDLELFLQCIDGKMSTEGIAGVADTTPPRVIAVRPVSMTSVQVQFSETVDPVTASDPSNYSLTDGVNTYTPTAATVDTATGSRVMLTVPLHYVGCPLTYTLIPGPVQDIAGAVNGSGVNNALDTQDTQNQRSFLFDGTITVTFGNTGAEMFPSVARDASFSSQLSSLSNNHIIVIPNLAIPTKGFIGFDFIPTLTNVCGVTDAVDIVDARFSLLPKYGFANTLELRRCYKPWNQPPRDECIGCSGAVTRQHATFNTVPWAQSGARSRSGNGTSPSQYYPSGTADTALAVDATVVPVGLNQRVEFASPAVTDAFKFWFANPTLNRGYAMNAVGSTTQGTEFWGDEEDGGRNGASLSITFMVHPQSSTDCDNNSVADECQIAANPGLDTNHNGVLDACEAGACCMNGTCQIMLQADCETGGGVFQGVATVCDPNPCPPPPCHPDFNHDQVLNSQDLFDFLTAFFTFDADYNADGVTNSQDLFDFLTDFFAGC